MSAILNKDKKQMLMVVQIILIFIPIYAFSRIQDTVIQTLVVLSFDKKGMIKMFTKMSKKSLHNVL